MKLQTLQAVMAAVETGSLRAAARRLGVSQPALTKMMRELETELGTTLFERTTTGVLPTAAGRVLYERARVATRELEEAAQQIMQMSGQMVGELGVGAVPLALLVLMPETLRTFSQECPQVRVQLREELYVEQLGQLHQHNLDVVVGPVPRQLRPGEHHVERLMPVEMVVVARRGHPVLAREQRLADLAQERWVYTGQGNQAGPGGQTQTGYVRTLYETHGLPAPPPSAVVNSTLGLLSLICFGDCLGLMPLPIARHASAAPYLSVVPVAEGPLVLEIGAIVRHEAMVKPVVRKFLEHLHQAAACLPHLSQELAGC